MLKMKYSLSNKRLFSFDASEIFCVLLALLILLHDDISVLIGIRDALSVVNGDFI